MTAPSMSAFGVTRSLTGRCWQIREASEQIVRALTEKQLPKVLAQMLAARNIGADEYESFLNPSLRESLPDPSLLPNMDKAVERAAAHIAEGKALGIFGDYDADGVCSAAQLVRYCALAGIPATPALPDRIRDGYGLAVRAIDQFASEGISLMITADCGIHDREAITHAAGLGVEVIILDHHPADEPPPEAISVNPNCPPASAPLFAPLAASGLVFIFLVALNRALRRAGWFSASHPEPDLMSFLDIAALGTICDVAPLTGINRLIVLRGLNLIGQGRHPGLAALAGRDIGPSPSSQAVAFSIGPRINAAGRIGHPEIAMNLLTASDEQTIQHLAAELEALNRQRQRMEKQVSAEAAARIEARYGAEPDSAGVIAAGRGWHAGVLGIAAARMRDRYRRNAFVIGIDEQGIGTGSARGLAGFDLGVCVRAAAAESLLVRGGGHPAAAGFTIEESKIPAFDEFLHSHLQQNGSMEASAALILDGTVALSGLTRQLYGDIQRAGPFGKGNPEPFFALESMRLMNAMERGGHLRCVFAAPDGERISVMAFRQTSNTPLGSGLLRGLNELFHIAGTLRPAWRGAGVELILEDAAPVPLS